MNALHGTRLRLVIAALGLICACEAKATEGYFLAGAGATQTSLAGAGVADPTDAMSATLNPAGIVGLDRQFQFGLSLFAPWRGYDASGTAFVAPGDRSSSEPVFLLPNLAYSSPIDASSAWGVALYANGGLNTYYRSVTNTGFLCPGANGVFCAPATGVNLSQAFLQGTYARSFGAVSIGVAPVLAVQQFNAEGFGFFAENGFSASPGDMTNKGVDTSVGAGLHLGLTWKVNDVFRVGLSGGTPTFMMKFARYQGLFANQGGFDIPAWVDAGVAFDVVPALTLLADYKRIFYSAVGAVADSSQTPGLFGSTDGPGFGWRDVDVGAFGAEWRRCAN